MSVVAWRVVEERYAVAPYNPFDGEGARLYGGRWNSVGVAVVYTSAGRSLAILERLVHAKRKSALLDCCIFPVTIGDERLIATVDPATLPANWTDPTDPTAVRALGDAWVEAVESPVLRVPSAVVDGEDNLILNPRHPKFSDLQFGAKRPLPIDRRLLVG